MNLILMKSGYPPAVVKAENADRIRYYDALETAGVDGDLEPFCGVDRRLRGGQLAQIYRYGEITALGPLQIGGIS